MSAVEVVALGEPLAALVAVEPGPLRFGSRLELQVTGAELNVAVALARLGHRSAFVGCVGDDRLGRLIARELAAEGVQASLRAAAAPTALLVRDIGAGAPEVDYRRSASAGSQLRPEDVPEELIAGARFLHLTGITPSLSDSCLAAVAAAQRIARHHGVLVSVDVNYRSRLWSRGRAVACLAPLFHQADVIFGSPDELALVNADAGIVMVKEGAAGATASSPDGRVHEPSLPVAAPVDPVGAGDAFAAGVLSGLLDGLDVRAALRRGHRCAAPVIATRGDLPGLPSRADLEREAEVVR